MPMRLHSHRTRGRGRLVEELRRTIDCLPTATREAMLAGVRDGQPIIAGAYVDGEGGVCPMLAAHRRGGRTDFLCFARAWDRFTGAADPKRTARGPRRAGKRELGVLIAHLEASLLDEAAPELGRAISEHRELARRSRARLQPLEAAPPISDGFDPRGEIRARRLRRSSREDKPARRLGRRAVSPVAAGR